MSGYELLDTGGGARLERFGDHVTDRPHGGALGERRDPDAWREVDLRFDRERGWDGPGLAAAQADWTVRVRDLTMELRPTDAGQVGIFPEHAELLTWMEGRVASRTVEGRPGPEVLSLFAYTGLATLALARAGARVTHVDAARPSVSWARRNALRNALADHPVRWIVDDARAYAGRELRRGRAYDGIVLDPPSYGHGAGGTGSWRLDDDLPELLATLGGLLAPDGFALLTAHTEGYDADRLAELLAANGSIHREPAIETGALAIEAASGATLHLGAFAALDRRDR